MSEKITIRDLEGLSDYATSITTFAGQYETAIASSRRSFKEKTDGAEAEAITAFFAKLNEIQSRVLDQYPDALRSYAQVVSSYYDAVSGEGFSSEVKSLQTDADNVASTLKGSQYTAVTTITSDLQSAFNKAAAAMGTEAESVSSIDEAAESSLSAAADDRQKTATNLDSAYSSFVSSLQGEIATLKALKTSLDNASYVLNIPPSTISTAIKSGNLSADEMNNFDNVKSKTDAKALTYHYQQDYDKFFTLDSSAISDEMYDIVTVDMNEILMRKDKEPDEFLQNLTKGLNTLISGDYKNHQNHLQKLSDAGNRYSSIAFTSATMMRMKGSSEDNPTYKGLKDKLASNQNLRLLWQSLIVTGLRGQSASVYEPDFRKAGGWTVQKNKIENLTLTKDGFSYDVTWKRYIDVPNNKKKEGYDFGKLISESNNQTKGRFSAQHFNNEELLDKLKVKGVTQLKLENLEIPSEFATDFLVSAAGAKHPLLGMVVDALTGLANEDPTGDYSAFYQKQGATALETWAEIKDSKTGSFISGQISRIVKYYGDYQDNLAKIYEHNHELFDNYLGYGGGEITAVTSDESSLKEAGNWNILDPGSITKAVEVDPYDVDAYLRYQQLEGGIKDDLVNSGSSSYTVVKKQNMSENPEEKKVWDYLEKGSLSGYELYELDYDSFNQVVDYLEHAGITLPWEVTP
ncbi:hypothetical protein ACVRYP_04800 [Streptococcus rifensis]